MLECLPSSGISQDLHRLHETMRRKGFSRVRSCIGAPPLSSHCPSHGRRNESEGRCPFLARRTAVSRARIPKKPVLSADLPNVRGKVSEESSAACSHSQNRQTRDSRKVSRRRASRENECLSRLYRCESTRRNGITLGLKPQTMPTA
jgi:hypothetical protein